MKETTEIANVYRNYSGGYFKTLVSPEDTAGAFALIEMVLPKGSEPPLHIHTHEDETFYLLDGTMQFIIGNRQVDPQPGEAVFAPRMVPHLFKVISEQARFITLITPGKLWEYFIEFSSPCTGAPVVAPPQGPPPMEVIAQMMTRIETGFGVTFQGPSSMNATAE